jgi:hypothetical protein
MNRSDAARRRRSLSSLNMAVTLLFVTPFFDARAQSCSNGCPNWPICICGHTPQWASRSLQAHGAPPGIREPDAQRSLGAVAPRTIDPHDAPTSARSADECR